MDYKILDLDKIEPTSVDKITRAVQVSMTLPGFYEVKEYEGKMTIDGAMLKYIDPEAAIKRCLEIVSDPKDIVIDMISIGGKG